MAGVKYKIQFNFAPETEENADSTCFLPTKIIIDDISGNKKESLYFSDGSKYIEASATEATAATVEGFTTNSMGMYLRYQNRVSASEMRKGLYNRILRIAEIRLIPMKDE